MHARQVLYQLNYTSSPYQTFLKTFFWDGVLLCCPSWSQTPAIKQSSFLSFLSSWDYRNAPVHPAPLKNILLWNNYRITGSCKNNVQGGEGPILHPGFLAVDILHKWEIGMSQIHRVYSDFTGFTYTLYGRMCIILYNFITHTDLFLIVEAPNCFMFTKISLMLHLSICSHCWLPALLTLGN